MIKQADEQADERKCAGMLAPDGRCKTLDASGDGYVRAEDCIVLLMTALAAEGTQKVTALVHGTAVNQVRFVHAAPPLLLKVYRRQCPMEQRLSIRISD